MQLHVESTGVTDGLPLSVSAPERGCRCLAVGTREADAAGSRLRENAEEEDTSAHQQHLRSQRARSSTPRVFLSSCLSYFSLFFCFCLAGVDNTTACFFFSCLSASAPLPPACQHCAGTSAVLGHLGWYQRHHLNGAPDLQRV